METYHFLYCDGSCRNGKGGYGMIYVQQVLGENYSKFLQFGNSIESPCTNNIAELTALKECMVLILSLVEKTVHYTIRSDSEYSIKCITEWSSTWERNNWLTSTKKPVANKDLIQSILVLYRKITMIEKINIKLEHIKGHSGDYYNELCDSIAKSFSEK